VHFSIPEYTFVSVPRQIGRGGLYIHDSIKFRIKKFKNIASVLYEYVIIEISRKGCPTLYWVACIGLLVLMLIALILRLISCFMPSGKVSFIPGW